MSMIKRNKNSEEARKKMSKAHTGLKCKEETKKKISEANKGKHRTKEAREKISKALIGNKNHLGCNHAEETKRKIGEKVSKALKGRLISDECRKKIGERFKGKFLSKEHKQKLSKAHKEKLPSEETKLKMSRAHMGISPYNKGLTKETNKSIASMATKLKGMHHSVETRRKISIAHMEKKLSKKCKEKLHEGVRKWWAGKTKVERRAYMLPVIKASQKANPSSIEKVIWKILDIWNIGYETQVPFNNGKFVADIYVPSKRLIIECNGDYYHNYKIFPESKIRDKAFELYAENKNYRLIWLWEHDIKKNPEDLLCNKGIISLDINKMVLEGV